MTADADETKGKKIKTEKVYKKGKGITEQILFDDTFDWDMLEEESGQPPKSSEKLVELDLMQVEELEAPADTESEEDARGKRKSASSRASDEVGDPEGESEPDIPVPGLQGQKPLHRYWIAGGMAVALLPIAFLLVFSSSLFPPGNPSSSHLATGAIQQPDQQFVRLQPFLIPITDHGIQGFCSVTALLVIRGHSSEVMDTNLDIIRGVIYGVLTQVNPSRPDSYDEESVALAIRARVNHHLGTELIQDVRLAKRNLIQKTAPRPAHVHES